MTSSFSKFVTSKKCHAPNEKRCLLEKFRFPSRLFDSRHPYHSFYHMAHVISLSLSLSLFSSSFQPYIYFSTFSSFLFGAGPSCRCWLCHDWTLKSIYIIQSMMLILPLFLVALMHYGSDADVRHNQEQKLKVNTLKSL